MSMLVLFHSAKAKPELETVRETVIKRLPYQSPDTVPEYKVLQSGHGAEQIVQALKSNAEVIFHAKAGTIDVEALEALKEVVRNGGLTPLEQNRIHFLYAKAYWAQYGHKTFSPKNDLIELLNALTDPYANLISLAV